MDKEKFRKLIISERTLEQISSEFLEKLKESHVQLVVVPNEMVSDIKMLVRKEHVSFILLSEDEKKSVEDLMEETENKMPNVFEIQKLPAIEDVKELYLTPRKKQKPYVPKTIGKPNAKKRGGR